MKRFCLLSLLFLLPGIHSLQAAPVNLSPPALPAASMCTGSGASWSYNSSTKTYTCTGRIVFPSNSSYTAKSTVTFYGLNGISVNNTTVGTAKARINLRSDYGSIDITGTAQRLFYGDVTSASGNLNLNQMLLNGLIQTNAVLTISNSNVSGTVVAANGINATTTVFGSSITANSGSIQLSGGQVAGLVRTNCCNLTTNGTSLFGGATVQSGISLTGGTVQGVFTMTALNPVTMTNVTMSSGSVTGASTITLTNTTAGSASATVTMTSNTGAITLNNSTVYGSLTAPSYSNVVLASSSSVYGSCTPTNTACGSVVVAPSGNCPVPNTNPTTGTAGKVIVNEMSFHGNNSNNDWFELYVNEGVHNLSGWTVTLRGRGGINEVIPLPAITFPWSNTTSGRFIILAASTADSAISTALSNGNLILNTNLFVNNNIALHNTLQELLIRDASGNLVYYMGYANNSTANFVYTCAESYPQFADTILVSGQENSACTIVDGNSTGTQTSDWNTSCSGTPTVGTSNNPESLLTRFLIEHVPTAAVGEETLVTVKACANAACTAFVDENISVNLTLIAGAGSFGVVGSTPSSSTITLNFAQTGQDQVVLKLTSSAIAQLALSPVAPATTLPGGKPFSCLATNGATNCLISSTASLHHYELSYNTEALTCQAQTVTVRACADAGCTTLFTNPISLTMVATESSNTASWVGGSAVTFSGGTTSKLLQQTGTGATVLGISSPTAVASEPALVCSSPGCVMQFADAAFLFYDQSSNAGIQNQVAGLAGNARLRAVKRNTTTGACEARLTGIKTVNFGFACVNPGSCQAGTSFTVNGSSINGVASTSPVNLSASAQLTFDANGYAPLSLNYSDVGQVQLAAQLNLAASGNDPATVISGFSQNFVVKPHHVAVVAAKRLDNFPNPATQGIGAGFTAAGEEFAVTIEVQNAQNQRTPNFGLENVPESVRLAAHSLIYPTGVGASAGVLESSSGFSLSGTAGGLFSNQTVFFSEVGTIAVAGQIFDNDYLGAGNAYTNASAYSLGRFYPDHFALAPTSVEVTDANMADNFSYMGQEGIRIAVQVEARNRQGNVTVNYDKADLNFPVASLYPVLENNNNGIDLAGRLNLSVSDAWDNGLWILNSSAIRFDRLTETTAAQPDGPFALAQFGLRANDALDGRVFQGMTINATTAGDCNASSNCNAVAVGDSLNLLYGRLELQNVFGPEDSALPLILQAKYWNGQIFVTNTADDTTLANLANLVVEPSTPVLAISTGGSAAALSNGTSLNSAMFFQAPNQIVSIPFSYNSPAFLQYHWNGTVLSNPRAEALFGRYRGNKRQIFWQERLN